MEKERAIIRLDFHKTYNIEEDREIYYIGVKTGILGEKVENLKGLEREITNSKIYNYEIKQFANVSQVLGVIKKELEVISGKTN